MKYLKNVVTLELDQEICIGCGLCTDVCPHAVFEIQDGKAYCRDRDACMECGACARNCPVQAIKVDKGVGCAYAIIIGALKGTEPCCDSKSNDCC